MQRLFSPFIFVFLFCFSLNAQIIQGFVKDIQSGKPLQLAHISIADARLITTSNDTGFFTLRLPEPGVFKMRITYMGYVDTIFTLKVGVGEVITRDFYLRPTIIYLDSVFITAGRSEQRKDDIPSRIASVSKEKIEQSPFSNTDEFMLLVPGIHTDRDFGIFSRNAGVTMRGMNSTARVLILVNGMPINKADGGGINWNRIQPENIQRIEIVKGPASAIHGGNAMAGVINIITDKPIDELSGSVKAGIGSYNTLSLNTTLSGNHIKNDTGFYWSLSHMSRTGDGYLVNPDELSTVYDTTVFIKELAADALLGYRFNKKTAVELSYSYWDDIRSDGVKVFETLGSYNKYGTHAFRTALTHNTDRFRIEVLPYYQRENYFRQSESVGKKNNKYRLYDTQSLREDFGVLTTITHPLSGVLDLTGGIDAKQGKVISEEIYYTSTDKTRKTGQLNQYAAFLVAQGAFLNRKLMVSLGLRYDFIQFRGGSFNIETPSVLTAFINNYPVSFTDENWGALSPKASAKYLFNNKYSAYVSYGVGYRPPMLDDMCTNRNISKGFKIANTQLAPEYLYNYESGFDLKPFDWLQCEISGYRSIGKGFHYFVGTGDSVDTGGEEMKAVLIRDNIAQVNIFGVENSCRIKISPKFALQLNYTYNQSIIASFKNDRYEDKNLKGKFLMEVPDHSLNSVLEVNTKFVTAYASFHFIGAQWADDENTVQTPAYHYFNLRFTSEPIKEMRLSLNIQNVLDEAYLNNKGQLCPGRFVMFDVTYRFNMKK